MIVELEIKGKVHEIDPMDPWLMGIVNVNDDSFSSDGSLIPEVVSNQMIEHIDNGVRVVDVGAESARTNRAPISIEEEIDRLRWLKKKWLKIQKYAVSRGKCMPLLSLNTWRSEVVAELLTWDIFDILNDMGSSANMENAKLCLDRGVGLLVMHTKGEPKEKHSHITYQSVEGGVMGDLSRFFQRKIEMLELVGMSEKRVIFDPGLDFAKSTEDSVEVVRRADELLRYNRPILMPISRKDFVGDITGQEQAESRDFGTLGVMTYLFVQQSVHIYRIHNSEYAASAIKVLSKVLKPKGVKEVY